MDHLPLLYGLTGTPANKFHRKCFEKELEVDSFPFEDEWEDDFWIMVDYYRDQEPPKPGYGHGLDAYEAFQYLRVARLKKKFASETPDVDPLVAIIRAATTMLDSCSEADQELQDDVIDMLTYYLYFDKVACDSAESEYSGLVDDANDGSTTVAHALAAGRHHVVLEMVLRWYPELRHMRTRGERCQTIADIAADLNDVDQLNQHLYRVIFNTTPQKEEIEPQCVGYKTIFTIKQRIDAITRKRNEQINNGSFDETHVEDERQMSHLKLEGTRYALGRKMYGKSEKVFILFAQKSQRKFVHKLCGKLETTSEGGLEVKDSESWVRSSEREDLKAVTSWCGAVIVVLSDALEALVDNKSPSQDSMLPSDCKDSLSDFFQDDNDADGPRVIALKDGSDDDADGEMSVSFLKRKHSVMSVKSHWSDVRGKVLHGLGMRLHSMILDINVSLGGNH